MAVHYSKKLKKKKKIIKLLSLLSLKKYSLFFFLSLSLRPPSSPLCFVGQLAGGGAHKIHIKTHQIRHPATKNSTRSDHCHRSNADPLNPWIIKPIPTTHHCHQQQNAHHHHHCLQ